MKNFKMLLVLIILSMLFFACEEGKESFFVKEDFEQYTLVITPNKTLVSSAKIKEFVLSNEIKSNFNQSKFGAVDIYVNGELIFGNEILKSQAGEYNIYAVYNNIESNRIKVTVEDPVLEKIELKPNKYKVKSNGSDIIKLEIKTIDQFGDTIEVTPSIYADGKPISTDYSTNDSGIHKIYAKVGNIISDEIEIEAEITIQDIMIKDIEYEFSENKKTYDLGKVSYDKEIITLKLDTENNNSTYKLNDGSWKSFSKEVELDLLVGKNIFDVKINESDNNIYNYEIIRKSSESRLSDLELIGYNINFDLDKKTYKLDIDKNEEEIIIKAISKDSLSEIELYNGKEWKSINSGALSNAIKLSYGINQIKVKVKAEDQLEKYETEYILELTRELNNAISSLSVMANGIELIEEFDSMKTEYDVIISSEIKKITIFAEALGESLNVIGEGTKNIELEDEIFYVYISEDSKYQINVHRQRTNTNLKEYKINDEQISEEEFSVSNKETKVNLKIVPEDIEKGKVEMKIGNLDKELIYSKEDSLLGIKEIDLISDVIEVLITIIAEDNKIQEKKSLIIRKRSTEANLKKIIIENENLDIMKYTQSINAVSNNKESVELLVEKEVSTQSLKLLVNGEEKNIKSNEELIIKLNEGDNIIKITVSPEEGEDADYIINIRRKTNNNKIKTLKYNGKLIYENSLLYDLGNISSKEESVEIEIKLEEENSKLEYKGKEILNEIIEIQLEKGKDLEEKIIVSSEEGEIESYLIKVRRMSDVNEIEILNYKDIEKKDEENYYWFNNIGSKETEFTFKINKDENSRVTYKNEYGNWKDVINNTINYNVETGENRIDILVTPEDKENIDSKNYIVKIYKENNISNLFGIESEIGDVKFDSFDEKYTYDISSDYAYKNIKLTPVIIEKSYSNVYLNNKNEANLLNINGIMNDIEIYLDAQEKDFKIIVESEDRSQTKIYDIKIKIKSEIKNIKVFANINGEGKKEINKVYIEANNQEYVDLTFEAENQFDRVIEDQEFINNIKIIIYNEEDTKVSVGERFRTENYGKYKAYFGDKSDDNTIDIFALKMQNEFCIVEADDIDFIDIDLSNDFYIGKFEIVNFKFIEFLNDAKISKDGVKDGKILLVINYQYEDLYFDISTNYGGITHNGYKYEFLEGESSKKLSSPVVMVTWWGAIEYCNWLSEKEGFVKAYNENGELLDINGNVTNDPSKTIGYRLPTEAEWEYAARGGKKYSYGDYAGGYSIEELGWCRGLDDSENNSQEVGLKKANELGIKDMSGNVFEYCTDVYNINFSVYNTKNPYFWETITTTKTFVIKGGSWDETKDSCKENFRTSSSSRWLQRNSSMYKEYGIIFNKDLGFRIMRNK